MDQKAQFSLHRQGYREKLRMGIMMKIPPNTIQFSPERSIDVPWESKGHQLGWYRKLPSINNSHSLARDKSGRAATGRTEPVSVRHRRITESDTDLW